MGSTNTSSTRRTRLSFIIACCAILLLISPIWTKATPTPNESQSFKPGDLILHHIGNAYEWHLFSLGSQHISIPLPVILYTPKGWDIFLSSALHHAEPTTQEGVLRLKTAKNVYLIAHGHISLENNEKLYDLSITKNVASMLLSVLLLLLLFGQVAKAYQQTPQQAPRGLQSLLEPIILFVRDEIAIPAIGKSKYERYMPYLLTAFFYIWINNLLGLLPGGANLTGNITITATLAMFTLLIILFSANKYYWLHIFAPPVPKWLYPIMIPIEIIGIFTKPFALTVRLFANITAGHIVILSLLSIIFIFKSIFIAPVSIAFALFINLLELLVAFIQAYVFTLLSALFIGQAVEDHHHETEAAHGVEHTNKELQQHGAAKHQSNGAIPNADITESERLAAVV